MTTYSEKRINNFRFKLQGIEKKYKEQEENRLRELKREMAKEDMEYIICKHDWSTWELRLGKQTWTLSEAVEWTSQPKEWGSSCFPKRYIPSDMRAYKVALLDMTIVAIDEGKLKAEYDYTIKGYHIFPLQFLSFLQMKNIYLPYACQAFLNRAEKETLYLEATRLVSKKLKFPCSTGGKRERRDSNANKQICDAAQKACFENRKLFSSYDDLRSHPEVAACIKSRYRKLEISSLNRLLSPYVTEEAKNPGCRPKKS